IDQVTLMNTIMALMIRSQRIIVSYCSCFIYISTTEIYSLSLHDALPISIHRADALRQIPCGVPSLLRGRPGPVLPTSIHRGTGPDRKSTRLNSSHRTNSYAVFCLKKHSFAFDHGGNQ